MIKAKSAFRNPQSAFVWLFFALVIIAVYFFALGSLPLVGPDEPRYAQVAREMFERGDWITPTLGGANWFEKPVLLYWLQIVFYKLFGVSEFAARFGPALFGLGTIFSLWILGRNFPQGREAANEAEATNNEQQTTNEFANWLALIAASSIGLLVFSRGASFDIILTFPTTASLVAFFISDRSEKRSGFIFYFLLFTFYFFIGIALLAKGLIGIVFPAGIVAFYYLLSWKLPDKTFIFSLFWGTLLSLLVASVWYLPMYNAHGWKFIDEFFIQHHFARYTSNKYQHPQPFYFFFWVLPLMTLPWLPFFLASIWDFFKSFFQRKDAKAQSGNKDIFFFLLLPFSLKKSLLLFSVSWLTIPLVFFSFSGSKLPGYILPALPAALILTAGYVFEFAQRSAKRKIALQVFAFATFAVVAFLLKLTAPEFAQAHSAKNLIEAVNAKGYGREKITNLFTVSHNAEFYAAGRLVRDADGKLKRYDDFLVLVNEMKAENASQILVLVPHPNTKDITESPLVEAEVLADNGDTAIVLARPKY